MNSKEAGEGIYQLTEAFSTETRENTDMKNSTS